MAAVYTACQATHRCPPEPTGCLTRLKRITAFIATGLPSRCTAKIARQRGNSLLEILGAEVQSVAVDVHENGHQAVLDDRRNGCRPGYRGHDHLVPGMKPVGDSWDMRAETARRFAEEPLLTITACLVPINKAKTSSNSRTRLPGCQSPARAMLRALPAPLRCRRGARTTGSSAPHRRMTRGTGTPRSALQARRRCLRGARAWWA